jgi:hypothetical protein
MGKGYIESATLGDELNAQDVTTSLNSKIKNDKIDVLANSSLIPMFESGKKVILSPTDETEVKDSAIKQCGNANDMSCIDAASAKLKQSKLEELMRKEQSSAFLVKGRRLTVNYIDEKGQRRTAIVPEGQSLKLDGLNTPEDPTKPIQPGVKPKLAADKFKLPTLGGTVLEALKVAGMILGAFLYAFSVIATYKTFVQSGYGWIGYGATTAAVMIPYSGFFIMIVFFTIKEYMILKSSNPV